MGDELYQGEYVPAVPAEPVGGHTMGASPLPQLNFALSEEELAQLVAAAGPVPEIEQYVDRPSPPLLVVLTGPSGVGKDVTLERMKELRLPFHYVVTVTTRKQRAGEIDGVHYHFVSKEEYAR